MPAKNPRIREGKGQTGSAVDAEPLPCGLVELGPPSRRLGGPKVQRPSCLRSAQKGARPEPEELPQGHPVLTQCSPLLPPARPGPPSLGKRLPLACNGFPGHYPTWTSFESFPRMAGINELQRLGCESRATHTPVTPSPSISPGHATEMQVSIETGLQQKCQLGMLGIPSTQIPQPGGTLGWQGGTEIGRESYTITSDSRRAMLLLGMPWRSWRGRRGASPPLHTTPSFSYLMYMDSM